MNDELCDEQMSIVRGGNVLLGWEPIELPTGRQQLPDWVGKASVDWGLQWAPSCGPWFRLGHKDASRWPGIEWEQDRPNRFIAKHPDGRATALYMTTPWHPAWIWSIRRADGFMYMSRWQETETAEQAQQAAQAQLAHIMEHPEWLTPKERDLRVEVHFAQVSEEQNGFGGSHYLLHMTDSTCRLLRGPWHGPVPEGYVEPLANGMLLLSEDLFLRIVADRTPHVGVARMHYAHGTRLEVYDLNWGMPKILYQQSLER